MLLLTTVFFGSTVPPPTPHTSITSNVEVSQNVTVGNQVTRHVISHTNLVWLVSSKEERPQEETQAQAAI